MNNFYKLIWKVFITIIGAGFGTLLIFWLVSLIGLIIVMIYNCPFSKYPILVDYPNKAICESELLLKSLPFILTAMFIFFLFKIFRSFK